MPGSRRVILRHVFAGLAARMCRSRPSGTAGAAPTAATAAAAAAVRQPTVSMSRLRRRLSATQLGILGCGHAASAALLLLLIAAGSGSGSEGGGSGGGLATLLTLLLAGAAAVLAGLVYAELAAGTATTGGGAAVAAGPAYAAAHCALGEFLAFLIGWNLLLEHVLGGAALARCIVEQLDGLLDGAVKNATRNFLPGPAASAAAVGMLSGSGTDASEHAAAGGLAALLCFIAATLAVVGASASGRRAASVAATCLAVCAITAMVAITVVAFTNADLSNWAPRAMHGLAPTGTPGVLTRAAAIMYIFSGLDTMAATAGGPTTSSPGPSALEALASAAATVATLPSASLVCAACAAIGILLSGAALSLMGLPGSPGAALSALADNMASPIGAAVGALAVAGGTGALLGTLASALAVIRAMASDGLLCRCVRTHGGAIIATISTALLALFLDLHLLVDLLSAGTLLAHASAAAAVLLLRYRPPAPPPPSPPNPTPPPLQLTRSGSIILSEDSDSSGSSEDVVLTSSMGTLGARGSFRGVLRGTLRGPPIAVPGAVRASLPRLRRGPLGRLKPGVAAAAAVIGLISAAALMGAASAAGSAIGASVPAFAIVACLALLCAHQQRAPPSSSPAPLEPLLPAAALVLDVTLLLHLRALAWIRLAGWTAVGLLVYFSYGIRHGADSTVASASSSCANSVASSADGVVRNSASGVGVGNGARAHNVHRPRHNAGIGVGVSKTGSGSVRTSLKRAPINNNASIPNSSHATWKPSSSSSASSADKVPFLVEDDSLE